MASGKPDPLTAEEERNIKYIEQLAAEKLNDASKRTIVATGFNEKDPKAPYIACVYSGHSIHRTFVAGPCTGSTRMEALRGLLGELESTMHGIMTVQEKKSAGIGSSASGGADLAGAFHGLRLLSRPPALPQLTRDMKSMDVDIGEADVDTDKDDERRLVVASPTKRRGISRRGSRLGRTVGNVGQELELAGGVLGNAAGNGAAPLTGMRVTRALTAKQKTKNGIAEIVDEK